MSALLLRCLNDEHAATADFIGLLDREAQAMSSGDFSALPALAGQKAQPGQACGNAQGWPANTTIAMA
jgi:hypothetical protein